MLQLFKFDPEEKVPYFNFLLLISFISSLKNLSIWGLYKVHNPDFFHYPLFDFLYLGSTESSIILIVFSIIISLFNFYLRNLFLLIVIGIINIYFETQDLLLVHHDVQFSGVIFILLPLVYLKYIKFYFLEVFFLSVYLVTGLHKLNLYFFEGDIIRHILIRYPYFGEYATSLPQSFLQFLAISTVTIEIFFPVILFFNKFLNKYIKLFMFLIICIYHFTMLTTGTGTVFNLLFPYLFLLLMNNDLKLRKVFENYNIDFYLILLFLTYSFFYIIKLFLQLSYGIFN
jgi:hypothetical protein